MKTKLEAGWTVGNKTTLCQWDPEQYFIEWKKETQVDYDFMVGTPEEFVRVMNVVLLVRHDGEAPAIYIKLQSHVSTPVFQERKC